MQQSAVFAFVHKLVALQKSEVFSTLPEGVLVMPSLARAAAKRALPDEPCTWG